MSGWFARIAVAAALALAVVVPCDAQAFRKAVWGPVYLNGVDQFPLYRQLGVSIYETQLYWSDVATQQPRMPSDPNDPAYAWPSDLDQTIREAGRFHMSVLLQILGTPGWANGGLPKSWAPTRASDFAAFAAAAARRYPAVHFWMIWGEPTRRAEFEPIYPAPPGKPLNRLQQLAPHNYAQLLDGAYGALKQVSKRNAVIGGCSFTSGDIRPLQWIQNLRLPNGRAPRMDMYAHNPFGYNDPNFAARSTPRGLVQFSDLPRLARWIDRYLKPRLPIFISEWTIPTAPDQEFPYWVDPRTAAKWIRDGLRLARGWHRIYGLGWINVYDDPPRSAGGLLTVNGVPKPGFAAFAAG